MSAFDSSHFHTTIPARLDRLPWCRFHWTVVFVLGITWVLDGVEVTLGGAISAVLQDPNSLGFSSSDIGLLGSFYVAGAVIGALVFGYLTDRWGRKRLFYITLVVYLSGVVLSGFAWNIWSFCFFRFLTGAGIGGEYAAINSAIDELIPARVRGQVDLMINGSYWLGAILASLSTLILLDPAIFPVNLGWRIGFLVGGALSLIVLFLRKSIPESPRWLLVRGRLHEAEEIVSSIESQIESQTTTPLDRPLQTLAVNVRSPLSVAEVLSILSKNYRRQSLVSLALIISQAFMYNAIFFTYGLVLTTFYHVPPARIGIYLLPFALGNWLGPFFLGSLFDSIGRRRMIAFTYAASGILLAFTGGLMAMDLLTATSQTLLWCAIFFFGSAAASSAYLTVSEIFPLETRGLSIALFFSVGTGIGGVFAPWIFSQLITAETRQPIFYGYLAVALLMICSAISQWYFGVDAEGKSLEEIAHPISSRPSSPGEI